MTSAKKSRPARSGDRAPRFKVWLDGRTGAKPWMVETTGGRRLMTRKVWINVLAETVVGKTYHYIRGEGYVTRNDDGSISIN